MAACGSFLTITLKKRLNIYHFKHFTITYSSSFFYIFLLPMLISFVVNCFTFMEENKLYHFRSFKICLDTLIFQNNSSFITLEMNL